MKNKEGFTLVELLAVIAILAILVIIALPNIVGMFNGAKKNLFLTEAKTLFKETSNKFISGSMSGSNSKNVYCKSLKDENNPLDVTTSNTYYYIETNSTGKITKFIVWNNSNYLIKKTGDDIKINDLDSVSEGEDSLKEITCVNVLNKLELEENKTLDKNVSDLTNTTWILNDNGYNFSLVGSSSTSNKLSDLPKVHINFVSNGINYTGIDSIYLPFSSPINTVSGLIGVSKIDFPFGDTIDMNSGAIVYVISDSEGAFVPYYINKWINNNYKTINITGGEDANNTVVIDWFKNHGERIK